MELTGFDAGIFQRGRIRAPARVVGSVRGAGRVFWKFGKKRKMRVVCGGEQWTCCRTKCSPVTVVASRASFTHTTRVRGSIRRTSSLEPWTSASVCGTSRKPLGCILSASTAERFFSCRCRRKRAVSVSSFPDLCKYAEAVGVVNAGNK